MQNQKFALLTLRKGSEQNDLNHLSLNLNLKKVSFIYLMLSNQNKISDSLFFKKENDFDMIVIGESIHLPQTDDILSLLYICQSLSKSKKVIIPIKLYSFDDMKYLGIDQSFFSSHIKKIHQYYGIRYVEIELNPQKKYGIYDWYFFFNYKLLLNHNGESVPMSGIVNTSLQNEIMIPIVLLDLDTRSEPDESLDVLISFKDISILDYFVHGSIRKKMSLELILNDFFMCSNIKSPIKYLDHGSGPAFLPLNLLSSSNFPLKIDATDPIFVDTLSTSASQTAYHDIPKYLSSFLFFLVKNQQIDESHFFFTQELCQNFQYHQNYDCISFIHLMYHVPKNMRKNLIENAYNALNPNGLLIVQEHVKNPNFHQALYYNQMLEQDEIDELFSQHQVFYYDPNQALSYHSSLIQNQSHLIRVIQKKSFQPIFIKNNEDAVINDYHILISYIKKHGYQIKSLEDYKEGDEHQKIIFLRFDVHLRDIEICHEIAKYNDSYEICGDFYLHYNYANEEIKHAYLFDELKQYDSQYFRIGFHTSVIDHHMINHFFEGNETHYVQYLNSIEGTQFFEKINLAYQNHEIDPFFASIIRDAKVRFELQLENFKERFPTAKSLAVHGGKLNQIIRNYLKRQDLENLVYLFAETQYIDEKLPYGFLFESDLFSRKLNLNYVADNCSNISQFMENLNSAILTNRAILLLLHPLMFQNKKLEYQKYIRQF